MVWEGVERGLAAEEVELAEYERLMVVWWVLVEVRNVDFLECVEDVLEVMGEVVEVLDVECGFVDVGNFW